MKQIQQVSQLNNYIKNLISENKSIGLIPTMGYLHEGHESLINKSKKENDITIVSIYINPIQFDNEDDYEKYPRNITADIKRLRKLNCDLLFHPDDSEITNLPKQNIKIKFDNLTQILEANMRPGHFEGVITIVTKLFKVIKPNKAYFGEKDLQQLLIIQKLCAEKYTNIQIIKCPTIREFNGLAKSSRNKHLDIANFNLASNIFKMLKFTKKNIKILGVEKTKNYVTKYLNNLGGINLEYFEIISSESFSFTNTIDANSTYYGLIAVKINNIRLIDNIKL
tara:strand:- start:35222 stop:36064 length:843 start_codon:yes stop_codon:yes gene_type:complete